MGRASRRKSHRGLHPASPEDLLAARIATRFDNVSFRHRRETPPDLPPLSERLTALIAPYRSQANTLDAYRALTTIAVLAWNLSLQPDSAHERYIAKAIPQGNLSDAGTFRNIVSHLIERKRHVFPDDPRLIAGHEVSPTSDGFHLVVASANLGAT